MIGVAVISLVVILLCWTTVPHGAWVGAGFDLLVMIVLLTPLKDRTLALTR